MKSPRLEKEQETKIMVDLELTCSHERRQLSKSHGWYGFYKLIFFT
jgi:hypothetical protein